MQATEEPVIVALFRHNTWANLRLVDACAELSEAQLDTSGPGAYGTIREILVHLVANEERYLGALTSGWPANPLRRGEWPGCDALRERLMAAGAGLEAAAATARLSDVLHPEWQGQIVDLPAYIVLIQAINHATEHRTNITTILSQEGIPTPGLDGWTYQDAE